MDWHPFSGPWGAFVVGFVSGALAVSFVVLLALFREATKRQKTE